MPVFAVLAHNQPELMRRLVDALAPNPVILHVDAKTNLQPFQGLPRVTYITDRVDVRWGGFSVIEATIRLFEAALDQVRADDHIVLLSGQCHPVLPVENFTQFLSESKNKQHCSAALVFDGTEYAERRLGRSWYFDLIPLNRQSKLRKPVSAVRHFLTRVSPKKSANNFAPYRPVAGSQWIALTGDCVRDILPLAKDPNFQALFRRALAPDEMFFHTLVHNSRWASETGDTAFHPRAMRGAAAFANFHHIDPSLTRDVTLDDLPAIQSSGAFFARKFDLPRSEGLMKALKQQPHKTG